MVREEGEAPSSRTNAAGGGIDEAAAAADTADDVEDSLALQDHLRQHYCCCWHRCFRSHMPMAAVDGGGTAVGDTQEQVEHHRQLMLGSHHAVQDTDTSKQCSLHLSNHPQPPVSLYDYDGQRERSKQGRSTPDCAR